MSDTVLTPLHGASFQERMAGLKQIASVTGVRLPATIIPEGDSLIPYGEERKRALQEEIAALPTLDEMTRIVRDVRAEQHPKDVLVPVQRVRMNKDEGGIYGKGHEATMPFGYTETGFNQLAQFVKPASVTSGFTSTLLALPPALRADAFNYFAENQTAERSAVLRTTRVPFIKNGAIILRRSVNAVVSEKYAAVEDYDIMADINAVLPDGAKARYTQTESRSDLEILWPAMARELKVGDIALIAVQVTNSQVKASAIRLTPKILRILCLNFTTAWGEGETEVVIRHIGEARRKFAEALKKAINTVAPFVIAFGDAYKNRLPEFAPTRGEAVGKFLGRFELSDKFGPEIVKVWDADGEKSAGDTLAGLVNAITRASQNLTIENAEPYEKAAGRLVVQGWGALEDDSE